jgi:hypothetical protein
MDASMNGPNYVQWRGFYEVAKIFYSEFLPEAERLLPGVTKRGYGEQLPPVDEGRLSRAEAENSRLLPETL